MVETAPCVAFQSMLDLLPVAIAVLVSQTEKHNVSLFREVLGLLDDVDEHLLDGPLIRSDLLLDQDRSLAFERMHSVRFVELLLDVGVVIQRRHFFEEDLEVILDFLRCLRTNVIRDRFAFFPRIELERLAHFLVVATVPIQKAALEQDLLLDLLLIREVDVVDTLEVAAVLRLKLFLDEFFEALRVVEESVVLHNLELFLLRILGDADVLALENLGTQVALVQVLLFASRATSDSSRCILRDHVAEVLVDLELGFLALLLRVVHVFELIQVHRVHLKVSHVHFVFHLFGCLCS